MDKQSQQVGRVLANLITGKSHSVEDGSIAAVRLLAQYLPYCREEGLLAMLHDVYQANESLPVEIATELKLIAHQAAAIQVIEQRAIDCVLTNLQRASVQVLVIKGAALAYQIYSSPWHRSRADTDLLVQESDLAETVHTLQSLGYEQQISVQGKWINSQRSFKATGQFGVTHVIDLHWRINNSWRLSEALYFDEMWSGRRPVNLLSSAAFTLCDSDALLLAAIHRAGHMRYVAYVVNNVRRYESDFTLWLMDIHLLAGRIAPSDFDRLCQLAVQRRMATYLIDALQCSVDLFGTQLPAGVLTRLRQAPGQFGLRLIRFPVVQELLEIITRRGWRNRLMYLGEHLFPSAEYMAWKYGSERSLSYYYLLRLLGGIRKRFQ